MPPRSARRAQKKAGAGVGLDITVDGQVYRYDPSDVTWRQELELFNATKLTRTDIFKAFANQSFAPVLVAGLVFLARRSAGDKVSFDEVAEAISYSSEIDVEILGDGVDEPIEAAALPEGQAAD